MTLGTVRLGIVVATLAMSTAAVPAFAGPVQSCCICTCGSLTTCEDSPGLCATCDVGVNQTCESASVPGPCSAVSACAGVGTAAAPALGANALAALAALLGTAGIVRVRRRRRAARGTGL